MVSPMPDWTAQPLIQRDVDHEAVENLSVSRGDWVCPMPDSIALAPIAVYVVLAAQADNIRIIPINQAKFFTTRDQWPIRPVTFLFKGQSIALPRNSVLPIFSTTADITKTMSPEN